MSWRTLVVSTVETARFLWGTRKYRSNPSMRLEREHAVYIWRCEWSDFTSPVRPHQRCWICGEWARRWWRAVPHPCGCP